MIASLIIRMFLRGIAPKWLTGPIKTLIDIAGGLAVLAGIYFAIHHSGVKAGEKKANAQIQKLHAKTVAEAVADSGKARVTANAIGDQVKHNNQLATDFVQSKIEDMHHALDVPPATPGGSPPPVDTVGVSASIDGLIDRANRAAEAADAEP